MLGGIFLMDNGTSLKKDIGLIVATALVTGNMMGSGIFMLPATLASKSGPGAVILAWLLTGIGSILIALSFGRLGSAFPKSGGPYEYSKTAFGDFMGFINAWLYWNGSWIGNAAVVVAVTTYTGALFPAVSQNPLYSLLYSSAILWIFTIINILGVKRAGSIQTSITVFEIILFLGFIIVAAMNFKPENVAVLFPEGYGLSTVTPAATATLWAFVGLESASITAEEIRNPQRNVKLSTILGICIAMVMYLLISFTAMGAMPREQLALSTSPIIDIFQMSVGSKLLSVIKVGAFVSIIGTTIGWLLSTARVAYAAGVDKTFPPIFGKVHPRFKTPYVALIIGSVLVNLLLILNYSQSKTLLEAFNFIILLATLSFLPVYAFTVAADIILLVKVKGKFTFFKFVKTAFIPLVALAYAMWTVYGSGAEAVMYGFLLLLSGVPFYVYMKHRNGEVKN